MAKTTVAVLLFVTALAQAAPRANLRGDVRSPLFGGTGGEQFDDSTIASRVVGIRAINVTYGGDFVHSIQGTYVDDDGNTYTGTRHGKDGAEMSSLVVLANDETIVRVNGKARSTEDSQYISQITFITRLTQSGKFAFYGPYGAKDDSAGIDQPFSYTGSIAGIFGRSGTYIDAIGFVSLDYGDPYYRKPLYSRTEEFGGDGGNAFDDDIAGISVIHIYSMTIYHGDAVDGISITYTLSDHTTKSVLHGQTDATPTEVVFQEDEKIVTLEVFSNIEYNYIHRMSFTTLDSTGMTKKYGPFGILKADDEQMERFYGVVYGFYGRANHYIDALGCYI